MAFCLIFLDVRRLGLQPQQHRHPSHLTHGKLDVVRRLALAGLKRTEEPKVLHLPHCLRPKIDQCPHHIPIWNDQLLATKSQEMPLLEFLILCRIYARQRFKSITALPVGELERLIVLNECRVSWATTHSSCCYVVLVHRPILNWSQLTSLLIVADRLMKCGRFGLCVNNRPVYGTTDSCQRWLLLNHTCPDLTLYWATISTVHLLQPYHHHRCHLFRLLLLRLIDRVLLRPLSHPMHRVSCALESLPLQQLQSTLSSCVIGQVVEIVVIVLVVDDCWFYQLYRKPQTDFLVWFQLWGFKMMISFIAKAYRPAKHLFRLVLFFSFFSFDTRRTWKSVALPSWREDFSWCFFYGPSN